MIDNFNLIEANNFNITSNDKNAFVGIVCLNLNTFVECIKHDEYARIFTSNLVLCDGFWTEKLLKLRRKNVKQWSGPDFFLETVLNYPEANHCIIGSSKESYEGVIEFLGKFKKDIKIDHIPLPYTAVSNFNYKEISQKLIVNRVKFAWISLGAPKQEIFQDRLLDELKDKKIKNNMFLSAIGAAIDFYSSKGSNQRAPKYMRQLGLEWFWRVLKQPKKTIKRLARELIYLPVILKKIYYNR